MEAEVVMEEGWIHGPGTGAEFGESSWQTLQPHAALQGLREWRNKRTDGPKQVPGQTIDQENRLFRVRIQLRRSV